ncbi:beta-lactamase family protein [Virgibacillus sp. NKC19-3]|uniref:serine hydrolase domain-containing protein n=1 Tax=Virgibacillus saliphilus TaxID=2831674 RepID=UPI001C9B82A8|nr:serine hydrolase domain-containing protein [Virgibacillus sp. NKC19-3]MBY7144164.1 beta-lactamase family protein [Virgibacillus sp. NKC19-3]
MKNKWLFVILICLAFVTIFTIQNRVSFAASSELLPGEPESVHMLDAPLNEMDASILQSIQDKEMPGAVAFVAREGKIVKQSNYGHALRYVDDEFTEVENPVDMENDTIFDLASISKLFTVTAAMQLYEEGEFELDDPVAKHIPAFAENDKSDVTIRQLMTHTSGFTAWIPLENMAENREEAFQIVFGYPLENEPGDHYEYSDLNMITLGALVEEWSGMRLDEYVSEHITEPLGMTDTMYNPPETLIDRIAATAYVPGRGMVHGDVHDGNAFVLDGVAGHAGVFSTAFDLAVFSQMMLNEGTYNDTRILKEETVELITQNHTPEFPGDDHGLGWELNQEWYMGTLAETTTIGHTGFTGTSVVISPTSESITILLTNRVHPIDQTPSTNPIRQEVAEKTADAINAWSANTIKELVANLEEKGDIPDEAARTLNVHLTAVSQYEQQESVEKVTKHLEGFKNLLNHQQENGLMSEEIYHRLKQNANYLIGKWQ